MKKDQVFIEAKIKVDRGNHLVTEDRVSMEIHDFLEYAIIKYATNGNKVQALPALFTIGLSREEARIQKERIV